MGVFLASSVLFRCPGGGGEKGGGKRSNSALDFSKAAVNNSKTSVQEKQTSKKVAVIRCTEAGKIPRPLL